jgi:uncharacterized repeat protein (TIGR03803 family)
MPRLFSRPASLLICAFLVTLSLASAAHAQVAQTVIYDFCQQSGCPDGSSPLYGMSLLANGSFIATADDSGPYASVDNGGAMIELTPTDLSSIYTYSYVAEFAAQIPSTSGYNPSATPIQGLNGNLYLLNAVGGVTPSAQTGGGTIFEVAPPYNLSLLQEVIYTFCSSTNCADGSGPNSLIQASDGTFYGTTATGGAYNKGTVFHLDSSNTLTVLHSFCANANCPDGISPVTLLQGADGNFYGTTYGGGSADYGTMFQLTPSGTFAVLHSFCSGGTGCPDGAYPEGALVQSDNGNIYGVTLQGGSSANVTMSGTVFYIDTTGAFHTLIDFGCLKDGPPCISGTAPFGSFVQGSDGNLYGTTYAGGTAGAGTVYQLPLNGNSATTIFSYCAGTSAPCANGSDPWGEFITGPDGNLYGTLAAGGPALYNGVAYFLSTSSFLKPPVQLTLSASTVSADTPVTLSWTVPYAYSKTLQVCGAFVQNFATGAGKWTGLQTGTYANHAYSGSSVITPTAAGTYTYALTCGGRQSGFATLTVTPGKANSTSTLSASPSSLSVGQSTTLKATVTGSSGTPTGSVTFSADGATLATVSLNGSGVASLTASTNGTLPATYPVTATYNGNSSYNSAASKSVSVTLNKAPTSITLTASPTSVTPPANVILTATVKRSAAATSGTPTGSVTFSTEGVTLATVKLNASGVAKLTASSSGYPAAAYPIKAVYAGDSFDTASTSSAVTVTVK